MLLDIFHPILINCFWFCWRFHNHQTLGFLFWGFWWLGLLFYAYFLYPFCFTRLCWSIHFREGLGFLLSRRLDFDELARPFPILSSIFLATFYLSKLSWIFLLDFFYCAIVSFIPLGDCKSFSGCQGGKLLGKLINFLDTGEGIGFVVGNLYKHLLSEFAVAAWGNFSHP